MASHTVNGVTYTEQDGNFLADGRALNLAQNIEGAKAVVEQLPWELGRPTTVEDVLDRVVDGPLDSFMNGGCEEEDRIYTYEEVLERLGTGGWERGVSKLKKLVESIEDSVPEPQQIRPHIHWGDQGEEFDIHRMWAGAIDRAWSSERGGIEQGPRIVKLVVPFGCSAGYGMDEIQWMGASAVILCDVLEKAGFRVEIMALRGSKHGSGYHGCLVTLKEADEYVSLSDLALMLCHPVSWRTIGMRQWIFSPTKWSSGTYGQAVYVEQDYRFKDAMEAIGAFDTGEDTIALRAAFSEEECREATQVALSQVEKLISRDEAATD